MFHRLATLQTRRSMFPAQISFGEQHLSRGTPRPPAACVASPERDTLERIDPFPRALAHLNPDPLVQRQS